MSFSSKLADRYAKKFVLLFPPNNGFNLKNSMEKIEPCKFFSRLMKSRDGSPFNRIVPFGSCWILSWKTPSRNMARSDRSNICIRYVFVYVASRNRFDFENWLALVMRWLFVMCSTVKAACRLYHDFNQSFVTLQTSGCSVGREFWSPEYSMLPRNTWKSNDNETALRIVIGSLELLSDERVDLKIK